MLVIVDIWSDTIGAIRMPATAASAEPSDQLAAASRSGESPTLDAARWFSATAVVAMPNFGRAVEQVRRSSGRMAMPSRNEAVDRDLMPAMWMRVCGQLDWNRGLACAVAQHGGRLQEDQQAEGGDDAGQRRRLDGVVA